MARDPRYDVLFEPVKIGPKTTKNRFYQVPHTNSFGNGSPRANAAMRGMRAEGGWGVVNTGVVSICPNSDTGAAHLAHLWSDEDIPAFAGMVDSAHEHGALAGIELNHYAHHANGFNTRETPFGVTCLLNEDGMPVHTRAMDKNDIRQFRQWHKDAALRAKACGFDLIYVYCAHHASLPFHFLSRQYNTRIDEYGGSLENRLRLFREILEDTLEAVGDHCAVPVRFAVDELTHCDENESRDAIEMIADLPHLWDVGIAGDRDMASSRYADPEFLEPIHSFIKRVTKRPVVCVGRFTSPDQMASLVKRGALDLIGAARPSIADPFLPNKIEEGRIEDIRECIGCNICVTADLLGSHIRCTQNPTTGEEWRRGWHPEKAPPRQSDDKILVVGAGPSGLEAAHILGKRGHEVILADASDYLGGRVARECRLPRLAEWGRVRDYREYQIQQMPNVEIFLASDLSADHVLELGANHVAVATGASWRKDGVGRTHHKPIPADPAASIFSPDDIMAGASLTGPVIVYDDDYYYMGPAIAEKLRMDGHDVVLLTTAPTISPFTMYTMEQTDVIPTLMSLRVKIVTSKAIVNIGKDQVTTACKYSDAEETIEANSIVLTTGMLPKQELFYELKSREEEWTDAGICTVERIGDAIAPGIIAAAVWSGHRYARELGAENTDGLPFKLE